MIWVVFALALINTACLLWVLTSALPQTLRSIRELREQQDTITKLMVSTLKELK